MIPFAIHASCHSTVFPDFALFILNTDFSIRRASSCGACGGTCVPSSHSVQTHQLTLYMHMWCVLLSMHLSMLPSRSADHLRGPEACAGLGYVFICIRTYLVTVGGIYSELVSHTLLMLGRGTDLIASRTCLSLGRSKCMRATLDMLHTDVPCYSWRDICKLASHTLLMLGRGTDRLASRTFLSLGRSECTRSTLDFPIP